MMDYLVAVVVTSLVVTVHAAGHGGGGSVDYELGTQVQSAPIVLYGQYITNSTHKCEGCMMSYAELQIHAVLKDGGFLISENEIISIGNRTEEGLTKIPVEFEGNIIVFVKRISGSSDMYDWYEEMGFSGLHEAEPSVLSDQCGLMSDTYDIAYSRCSYECPKDKFLKNGQCIYRMDTEAERYSDAVPLCENDGASLASLDKESFEYFGDYFGDDFFWVDNSYPEDLEAECNPPKGWDEASIQMGAQGDRTIVVTHDGFCVPTGGTKSGAMALCSTDASPYIARNFENMAPDGQYTIQFETTDELYGHCCQKPKTVSPKTLNADFRENQTIGAAYMLMESTYRPSVEADHKNVILMFEDSGHMTSKGGQVNPYLVFMSVDSGESDVMEQYTFRPIVPEGLDSLNYNLYVIKIHEDQDIHLPEKNYSTYDCGEEYRGRCFFHLNEFLEDIGGEMITKFRWEVNPDASSLESLFERNAQHAGMLCHTLYDIEPNDHGFIICDSPVSGSEALHSGVTWILGLVLIGYHSVYKG